MLRRIYFFLILFFLILTTYFNSLANDFVFDDQFLILENKSIRSLKNIPVLLGSSDKLVFRPLRDLSYAIDHFFYSYNPVGYHFSNVLFLLLACCVVYYISLNFFQNKLLAFFSSIIFAVHPIHTEAITYVSGRKDALAGIFYFLGFYFFIKYRKTGRIIYFTAFLFNYIFAIFSKEISITLPLVLFLYDYFNLSEPEKSAGLKQIRTSLKIVLKKYAAFYATVFIFICLFCIYMLFVRSTSSINYMRSINIYGEENTLNIYTQIKITGTYLKLLLFPINLNADYTFNAIAQSFSIFEPQVMGNLMIILFTIMMAFIFMNTKWKMVSFFLLSILISMLPIIQIIKYPEIISERALFIPSLFFCLLLIYLINNIIFTSKKNLFVFLSIITIIFSVRTAYRNFDWKNSQILWEKTVLTSPASARAHYNLGTIYAKIGRHKDAIIELKKSLLINSEQVVTVPDYTANALLNLGNVYYLEGNYQKAIEKYEKVLALDTGNINAYRNIKLAESNLKN